MSNTFKALGIPEDLIRGLEELGIVTPTQVQASVIPFLLKDGGDLVAQAQLLSALRATHICNRQSIDITEGFEVAFRMSGR